ncbi:transcription antitermination factor NusB [Campylobacter sp. MIT 97-5078]|uniref:transcription antitermination factor NusB n=1 Tax=Campylobacter sp. MIT 97-5078 TaxID=1548153 RepID=UPI000513CBDC|nr:transcription antitermination factor NusB [Campylobacter sp. MIT 97-5078]KGI55796.1 N utilization substance protein B [Campylobacter sp. MIT 97-5078]KGI57641.1 N utilization substance protein B [Campylobacter sp. MIT 97-5078]TQR26895.1 transcription antitermination factor NusB [Campylobacter sp. MIT 97-5078]
MATRHQARKSVVSLLYASDLSGENQAFIQEFLEQQKIRNEQKTFALTLYDGVKANLSALDMNLQANLKEFNRLSKVELAILRLSVYELLFSDTDKAIIINEAIELGKELGNENSSKLINAVLDTIIKAKK